MREDEIFALEAVATECLGTWKPGENPPDGYIAVGDRVIAVEVSTLTQYVTDDRGTRARNSDDIPALRLANELDSELKSAIPADRRVILILNSPIVEFRKTKSDLAAEIVALASDNIVQRKFSIRGNVVEIVLTDSGDKDGKRIVGFVKNRASRADILGNVIYILEDRIATKTLKCESLRFAGPIWLALRNDYILADVDTYRHALKYISVAHPFEKIFLVSGDGSVDVLIDAAS